MDVVFGTSSRPKGKETDIYCTFKYVTEHENRGETTSWRLFHFIILIRNKRSRQTRENNNIEKQ